MEKVVRRPADISPKEAREGLALVYPNAKVASFNTVEHDGQFVYEAKLILAEFPPSQDDGGGDEGDSDGPVPGPPVDESDDGESDEKPKSEKKDKGEGGVGKKVDKLEKIVEQIAQAMGIPVDTGEGDEDGPPVPPGADAGDSADVPPPPPVAEDAPLPPPAAPKGGGGGGGGLGMPFSSVDHFAGDMHVAALRQSVASRRSFSMAFEDGNVSTRVVADTARAMFPDFNLTRIESRQGVIDGGKPQPMYVIGMVRR